MGALAENLLRKQMKSTRQDGYATYDGKRRQNKSGPLTKPVQPTGEDIGFSG